MAHITFRLSATYGERLLHAFDAMLDRAEHLARQLLAETPDDLREAAHIAQVRRLAARGCNGQALI